MATKRRLLTVWDFDKAYWSFNAACAGAILRMLVDYPADTSAGGAVADCSSATGNIEAGSDFG